MLTFLALFFVKILLVRLSVLVVLLDEGLQMWLNLGVLLEAQVVVQVNLCALNDLLSDCLLHQIDFAESNLLHQNVSYWYSVFLLMILLPSQLFRPASQLLDPAGASSLRYLGLLHGRVHQEGVALRGELEELGEG